MLARTASNLFWLARYMERADYLARLIQAAERMASISPIEDDQSEWHSAIIAAGCEEAYFEKYEQVEAASAVDFLVADPDNGSSIFSCLDTARRNARSVRVAITTDVWDAVNGSWLELGNTSRAKLVRSDELSRFLDWTKERAGLFNGAYANSMLRRDAFSFTRLGNFLERTDNTARILDVKYHVLLPRPDAVGGMLDYYHWSAILRSVSALRAYNAVYQSKIVPWKVAELLILRPELPRSLLFCMDQVVEQLNTIGRVGRSNGDAHRLAGLIHSRLRYGDIEEIFQSGLHEFLTRVVDDTVNLGQEITSQYLV